MRHFHSLIGTSPNMPEKLAVKALKDRLEKIHLGGGWKRIAGSP